MGTSQNPTKSRKYLILSRHKTVLNATLVCSMLSHQSDISAKSSVQGSDD